MVRLNRASEYALMALLHMSRKGEHEVTSAREVSEAYGLPFEITAKTLQKLRDSGLILSSQGARGGYSLARGLNEISLAEFVEKLEGPEAVVACCLADSSSPCEIRLMMNDLNSRVGAFLESIKLGDLAAKTVSCQRALSDPAAVSQSFTFYEEP